METVIAATDFSKAALNASKYAAAIAAAIKAQLVVLYVIEVPRVPMELGITGEEYTILEENAKVELGHLKDQLLFYTANQLHIQTEIKYGFTEIVLNDLCKELAPFAVVIGLKKASAGERLLFGSTALRVVPYMQYPLLIVPEKAVFSGIKNISIASDHEHMLANTALSPVKKWLNMFQAQPDILHVCTDDESRPNILSGNIYLYNRLFDLRPQFHSIHNRNIEDGIFDFIEQKKTDLLVVAPGKYSFFKKLFHSSHSRRLMLYSHLPVLVVPSHRFDAARKEILDADAGNGCSGCDGLCCKSKQPPGSGIDRDFTGK